jgi:glycerophosphoryl diester phosphodiesterase
MNRIEVHGHRGARGLYPENTLAGFAYAIDAGVDFIELDVMVSRDEALVVCHDAVLRRRCVGPPGPRKVGAMTLGELRQFDCGSFPNRRFRRQARLPGATIPMLEEVFGLAGRGRFGFNIELKTSDLAPGPRRYGALVGEAVRRFGLQNRVRVTSFNLGLLAAIDGLEKGALFEMGRRDMIERALAAGARTLGPYHRLATPRQVEKAHRAGLLVVPWTANRRRDWARLIRAGADGIITDDPARLLEYLAIRGLRV